MTLRIGDGKLEVTQSADTYSVTLTQGSATETSISSLSYAESTQLTDTYRWNTSATGVYQYFPSYVALDGVKFFGSQDDGWWEIPFPSWIAGKGRFFNTPIDRVFVSTNSYVTFRAGYALYNTTDILKITEPRILICAGDRNCPLIRYGTKGSGSNRLFIIKYLGYHNYYNSGPLISWELQFPESGAPPTLLYCSDHSVPNLFVGGVFHSNAAGASGTDLTYGQLPSYTNAKVTINAKQVDGTLLFSSDRWNPNIFGVISDTMTKGDLPGYQDLLYGRFTAQDGFNFRFPVWNSISVNDYDYRTTYVNYFPGAGDYFLLPFAKISLPTTGYTTGLYPLGDTGGQWASVQGGSVLRLYENQAESAAYGILPGNYNPRNYWPNVGKFQGSQLLNFRASNGAITAEVSTKIGGTTAETSSGAYNSFYRKLRTSQELYAVNNAARIEGRSGNQPQYNTGYTIEYKVYYGSIGSGNSIASSGTGTRGGDSTAGKLKHGIPGYTTYSGGLLNELSSSIYGYQVLEVSDNGIFTSSTCLSINGKKRIIYIDTLNLGYDAEVGSTGYTIEFWYYIRKNETLPILTLQNKSTSASFVHNNINGQYFAIKQNGVCEWTAFTTANTPPATQYYGLSEYDRDVYEWNYYAIYISNTEFKTWVNGYDHYTGTQTLAVGGDQQYNMSEVNTFIFGGGPDYENIADSLEVGTTGYFDNIRITQGDRYGKTLRRIPVPTSRLTAGGQSTTHLLSPIKT